MDSPAEVTRLLHRWSEGESEALDALLPLLYQELKRLARARMRNEHGDHSLNATALVHEAYLRLVDIHEIQWTSRGHFLAMAARQMRRILIDHARQKQAAKRGAGARRVAVDPDDLVPDEDVEALTDLDDGLRKLEVLHPRPVQAIELHYFGGLTLEETAEALGVSLSTVVRDLRFAEAWIGREWERDAGC